MNKHVNTKTRWCRFIFDKVKDCLHPANPSRRGAPYRFETELLFQAFIFRLKTALPLRLISALFAVPLTTLFRHCRRLAQLLAELHERGSLAHEADHLLAIDGGVAGEACHWAVSQMIAQSTKDAMAAAAERFLLVLSEVGKMDVEWGTNFFNYHREDGYLTVVPTEVPGRKALFDMWVSWSFKHQGFLAVMDTDSDGKPTEISFSLLSRGNGEFGRVKEAAQAGQFEGMPVARYSYQTGEVSVPREFYEKGGFEVITSFMRHGYKALREFNGGNEKIGKIASDFGDLLYLDDFEDHNTLDAPGI